MTGARFPDTVRYLDRDMSLSMARTVSADALTIWFRPTKRCFSSIDMSMMRNLILTCVLGLSACATPSASTPPSNSAPSVKVYELTFLQSTDTDPSRLVAFIKANWFAMDEKAQQAGLISNYRVLHSNEAYGAWNVMVMVGYPQKTGYEGVKPQFDAIRAEHQTVLIDGKNFPELGKVVFSKRLFP